MPETTRDSLLGGRIALLQPARGHRAGTDAVLLAAAAPLRAGDRVCDLGAGTGAVGLMLAARDGDCRVTLVEKDEGLAGLARENLALNGLSGRGEVLVADVLADALTDRRARRAAGLTAGAFDLVATNPPFLERGPGVRPSPDPGRREAHTLPPGGLAAWFASAADLLVPRGRLALIQRADQLGACLAALAPAFGSLVVRPVQPRAEAPATRILITAVRGGRAALVLAPALVLHGPGGTFTPEAAAIHAGGPVPEEGA